MAKFEDRTKAWVNHVENWARATLVIEGDKILQAERDQIEQSLTTLPEAFKQMSWMIEPMRGQAPDTLDFCYEMMRHLVCASATLGALALFTGNARKFYLAPNIRGGAETGKKRARQLVKKKEAWRKIARPMIEELIAKYPKMSQDDIASEVRAGWKDFKIKAPGHATMKAFVSEIKNGLKTADNVLKFKSKS